MQCLTKLNLLKYGFTAKICDLQGPVCVQVATVMKLYPPKDYSHVEYPERRKLTTFEKVPQHNPMKRPGKDRKMIGLMRGPELLHNKILYGDFAIQAQQGGRLRWGQLEMMRIIIARNIDESKMFATWRVYQPWQSVTKKGQGHRMGGGKGSISKHVFPLKAGRIILEMGGECELAEVKPVLKRIAPLLPFKARIVTREILEAETVREKELEEKNINPFTFQYCLKKNMLGIDKFSSPYDRIWHGKYR